MVTCHKSSSSSDKIIMTKQNCKSPPTNNPPPPPTRAAPAAAVAAKARQLIANNNYNNDNHDVFSGTPVAKRGECYSPPMPPPSSISSTSKANANSKTRSKKSPTTASGSAAIGKKSHKRQKHYEEIVKEIKKIMARNPQTRRKLRYLARKQRVQETVPTLSFAEEVLGGAGAACATPEHDDDKLLQLLQEEDSPPPPIIRLPALTADKIKTSASNLSRKPIEEKKSLSLTMEKNVPATTTTTTTTTAPLLNFAANTDNRLVLESRSPSPALPLHRDDEDTFIKEDMTKHQLLLMKNIKSLEKSQAVAAAAAAVDLRPKFTGNFKFTDRFMANEQQQQQPQLNQHQHHSNNLTIKPKPLITLPNFSTLNSSVVNAAKEVESRKSNENCAYPLHILGPRIQSKLFPQTMAPELPAAAAVVEGPLPEKAPAKTTTSSLSRLLEIRSPAKQQLRSPARRSPLSSPRPRSRSRSVSREATAAPAKDRSPSRDSLNSPPRPRNNCNDLEPDHDRDEDDDEDYHHHHHHHDDDEHCSASTRSSRSGGSCSDRSSRTRSSTRSSRSPSIPRRYGSPSFLDRRRITSARKRPIPYHRPTPSPSSSVDSSHSDDDDSSPSSSHHHNSHSDDAWSQKSYKSI